MDMADGTPSYPSHTHTPEPLKLNRSQNTPAPKSSV